MRLLKASVLLAVIVALFESTALEAAAAQSITGRLIFEDSRFNCEQQCIVTLLSMGVRPVQTVLADFSGRFTFEGVPQGSYAVRIDIDGFETVNHPLHELDIAVNIIVPLMRKRAAGAFTTDSHVVDVAEFFDRYPRQAVSFFEKGIESQNKKKNDQAMKYFEDAVSIAPSFYQAHNQLGVAYLEAGRVEDAEREFLKAHELNVKGVEPLLNLINLYLEQNDPKAAVRIGEEAVRANAQSGPASFGLGIALYRAGEMERSEAALKRALDLAPRLGKIRLMLANVYVRMQRYDDTLLQLDTYIAENPKGDQLEEARSMRDRLVAAKDAQKP
jgi:tetratricopeptide (TPR) repeat protein